MTKKTSEDILWEEVEHLKTNQKFLASVLTSIIKENDHVLQILRSSGTDNAFRSIADEYSSLHKSLAERLDVILRSK